MGGGMGGGGGGGKEGGGPKHQLARSNMLTPSAFSVR